MELSLADGEGSSWHPDAPCARYGAIPKSRWNGYPGLVHLAAGVTTIVTGEKAILRQLRDRQLSATTGPFSLAHGQ